MDMKNLEETWSVISPGLLGKEEGRLMDLGEMGSQALLAGSLPRKATGLQSCVSYMEAEGTTGNVSKRVLWTKVTWTCAMKTAL